MKSLRSTLGLAMAGLLLTADQRSSRRMGQCFPGVTCWGCRQRPAHQQLLLRGTGACWRLIAPQSWRYSAAVHGLSELPAGPAVRRAMFSGTITNR